MSLKNIHTYIRDTYDVDLEKPLVVPLDALCPNSRIDCKELVIDYDELRRRIVGDKCNSADALLIGKWINFIELKTGFANEAQDINARTHKENLKLRIRLKAYESLALLEKVILPQGGFSTEIIDEKKRFVAVVDTKEHPIEAWQDVLVDVAGAESTVSPFKQTLRQWLNDTLLNYRKEFGDGKHIFYVDTQVWYDYEVSRKIGLLV